MDFPIVRIVMEYNKLIYREKSNTYYLIRLSDKEYEIHYYGRYENGVSRRSIPKIDIDGYFKNEFWTPIKYLKGRSYCKNCIHE